MPRSRQMELGGAPAGESAAVVLTRRGVSELGLAGDTPGRGTSLGKCGGAGKAVCLNETACFSSRMV